MVSLKISFTVSHYLSPVADGVRKRKGNLTESESHKSASKTLSYDLDPIGSVKTDFSSDGGYQRVVQLTPDVSVMVTGGADGKLRAWKVKKGQLVRGMWYKFYM